MTEKRDVGYYWVLSPGETKPCIGYWDGEGWNIDGFYPGQPKKIKVNSSRLTEPDENWT